MVFCSKSAKFVFLNCFLVLSYRASCFSPRFGAFRAFFGAACASFAAARSKGANFGGASLNNRPYTISGKKLISCAVGEKASESCEKRQNAARALAAKSAAQAKVRPSQPRSGTKSRNTTLGKSYYDFLVTLWSHFPFEECALERVAKSHEARLRASARCAGSAIPDLFVNESPIPDFIVTI